MDPDELSDALAQCQVDQYSNALLAGRMPPGAIAHISPKDEQRCICPGDVMNAFCQQLPPAPPLPQPRLQFQVSAADITAPSPNFNNNLSLNPKFLK